MLSERRSSTTGDPSICGGASAACMLNAAAIEQSSSQGLRNFYVSTTHEKAEAARRLDLKVSAR
jgi:hypothetical protein